MALTTPVVTVCDRPNGLPIAITVSPIIRSSELPSGDVRQRAGPRRCAARRGRTSGSRPTSLASNSRAVDEGHVDAAAAQDDVLVGEDGPVAADDDARPEAGARGAARPRVDEVAEELLEERIGGNGGRCTTTCSVEMFTTAGLRTLDGLDDPAAARGIDLRRPRARCAGERQQGQDRRPRLRHRCPFSLVRSAVCRRQRRNRSAAARPRRPRP